MRPFARLPTPGGEDEVMTGLSGFGLGLRREHYDSILSDRPAIDWLEVLTSPADDASRRHSRSVQAAQHESRLTSLVKVCAHSLSASTIVRYGKSRLPSSVTVMR